MEGLTEAQACWSAGPLGTHIHLGKAGLKVCVCAREGPTKPGYCRPDPHPLFLDPGY